jgi:hypothetical protein
MHHRLAHRTNWQVRCSNFVEVRQTKRNLCSPDFNLNYLNQNWINFAPVFALLELKRSQKLRPNLVSFMVHSLIFIKLLLVYNFGCYLRRVVYVIIFSQHLALYFLSFLRSHLRKVPSLRHYYLELDMLEQLISISSLESSLFPNLAIQMFHSSP